MPYFRPRKLRSFKIGEFLSEPKPENPHFLCTYVNGGDSFHVHKHNFNLLLHKELKENVQIASDLAVHLAHKRPREKVLLINTYAGYHLMTECLSLSLKRVNVPHDDPRKAQDENQPIEDMLEGEAILPNLDLLDVPMGCWSHEQLEDYVTSGTTIVILNSFEFAGLTGYEREHIARNAITLFKDHPVTFILFSHEVRRDLRAGFGARGALGSIAAIAAGVYKLGVYTYYERDAQLKFYPGTDDDNIENPYENEDPENEFQIQNKENYVSEGQAVGANVEENNVE